MTDRLHGAVAIAVGIGVVAAIVHSIRTIALTEAQVSSWLIRTTGLAPSQPVGTAVIYRLGDHWVGFAITGGCSVALLMIPPCILAAVLISLRRVSWARGVTATISAIVLLVIVNQIRLYVIASSMGWWGFQVGYERSHVLIGSGITTVGLAFVAIIFLVFLARRPGRRMRSPGPRRIPGVPGARHAG